MSIHDYTGLTPQQIEAREAALARQPPAPKPVPPPEQANGDHKSPISPISPISEKAKPEGRDPRTGRFAKGWSGRPKGALNKSTLLSRALLEVESEHLVRHLVALGLSGDSLALRVAVMRLLPARRDLPVEIELPLVNSVESAMDAITQVIAMVGEGRITPAEGLKTATMIDMQRRAIHTEELWRRAVANDAAANEPPPMPTIRVSVRDKDGNEV